MCVCLLFIFKTRERKREIEILNVSNKNRVMLMSVFKVLFKNLIKLSFYEKRKKTINILTAFFISYKSDVKNFFNWILNQCLNGTH